MQRLVYKHSNRANKFINLSKGKRYIHASLLYRRNMPLLLSTSNRLNYNSLPHSPSPAGAVGEKMCVEAGKSAATSDLHQLL